MDSKRALLAKKIDSVALKTRTLQIVTNVMIVLYAIMFIAGIVVQSTIEQKNANLYQYMLDVAEQEQINLINEKIMKDSGTKTTSQSQEKPKFTNSKDAVIFAFNRLYNDSMYDIDCVGKTNSEAARQNVEIIVHSRFCKYSDGTQLDQICRKETSTNFGQSSASQIVYKNGKKYLRFGKLTDMNGNLGGDFSGAFNLQDDSKLTSHPFYVVNSETIKFDLGFNYTIDKNGNVISYTAKIDLDIVKGVSGYDEDVKEQGGTSLPSFKYVQLECTLDRNGDLISFVAKEKMSLIKHIIFDINSTTTDIMTYTFLSHNQTPKISQPQF